MQFLLLGIPFHHSSQVSKLTLFPDQYSPLSPLSTSCMSPNSIRRSCSTAPGWPLLLVSQPCSHCSPKSVFCPIWNAENLISLWASTILVFSRKKIPCVTPDLTTTTVVSFYNDQFNQAGDANNSISFSNRHIHLIAYSLQHIAWNSRNQNHDSKHEEKMESALLHIPCLGDHPYMFLLLCWCSVPPLEHTLELKLWPSDNQRCRCDTIWYDLL